MYSPILFPSLKEYNFVVLNKETDYYLDKITQEDYKLLINLLTYVNSSRLQESLESYGASVTNDDINFDNDKFNEYKKTILKERIETKGYTFFKLRNNEGQIIALASGNVEDKGLRLLNLVVHPNFRNQKLATSLLSNINIYLFNKFDAPEIAIPISPEAQNKSPELYKKLISKIEKLGEVNITSRVDGSIVINFKPTGPSLAENKSVQLSF